MKGKKIIIVVLALLVSMVVTISTYKNLEGTKVEEIEERQKNLFAIKVDNGNGNYEDSTGFPGTGYSLNIPLTKCEDQMGNKVSNVKITGNGTNVTVTSKYTVYCTLYFDKGTSLSQFCNGVELKTCIGNKKDYIGDVANMTTSLVGGMYRYQGIDNVNNWICFGTTSNCGTDDTNIDKYMYRIIGVTPEGELKLIKETFAQRDGDVNFSWNNGKYSTSDCGTNGEKCMWPDSMIFAILNGKGNYNIFIGNNYYGYLNDGSGWLDKIEERLWKYGVLDSYSYDGNAVYAKENAFTANTQAKIGLMYVHDYLYAYPDGNPGNYTNAAKSWIHYLKDGYNVNYCNDHPNNCNISGYPRFDFENTMTNAKYVEHPWYYYYLGYSGYLYKDPTSSGDDIYYGNRPVFYVISSIKIKSGTGEKTNPYIIDI